MSKKPSRSSRCCLSILLVLVACSPAVAQYKDSLGGNWNNPASATITNIIMDRYARRRLEKNLAAKHSSAAPAAKPNDAAGHFCSPGNPPKTREITHLINTANT